MKQSLLLEDGVFYVDFLRLYDGQPTTLRKFSIPRLRQLRIRLVRPSRDTRIFSKLEMSSLNELWMEREELGRAIRGTRIYEPLLANSSATLKRLIISEYSIPQSYCYIPRLNRSSRLVYQDMDGALRIIAKFDLIIPVPWRICEPSCSRQAGKRGIAAVPREG